MKPRLLLVLLLWVLIPRLNATVQRGSCGPSATFILDTNGLLTISGTGEINEEAFRNSKATKVIINEGITKIGKNAFRNCKLTQIHLPETLTEIGQLAFSECSALESILLPESLTTIASQAFTYTTSLQSIVIPQNVIRLGQRVFTGSGIKKCKIESEETISSLSYYESYYEGAYNLTDYDLYRDKVLDGSDELEFLEISCDKPDNIRFLFGYEQKKDGNYIVASNSYTRKYIPPKSLRKMVINIPKTLSTVDFNSWKENGNGRFIGGAVGLSEISVGNVSYTMYVEETIDSIVFNVPSTTLIKSIGFNRMKYLEIKGENFHIPTYSYGQAQDCLLNSCWNLEHLLLSRPSITDTSVFGEFFEHGPKISEKTDYRTVIQEYKDGSQLKCNIPKSLRKVELMDGCEFIPYGTFYGCNMLEEVVLPASLYDVGEKAFYGCSKMTDIYCKGPNPAGAYNNSFEGMRLASCILHVPLNTAEMYKRSAGWEKFFNIEEETPLSVDDVSYGHDPISVRTSNGRIIISNLTGDAARTKVYNIQGALVA